MLPFLKNRMEGAPSSPVETLRRSPDGDDEFGMAEAIAEDILAAVKKDDRKLLAEAIKALVSHIQDQDEEQDEQTMEGAT